MQREYFCANCGLYYWEEYPSSLSCPNPKCPSYHNEINQYRYACDSMGFAYFSRDNKEFIKEIAWSSKKYAHKEALQHYQEHGVKIR